ncbi:ER membrane protein complex subunit 2-like [Styela clava]|uniref:ER membrane protein complex subunit 2-like n=1 Tax=Styela clava TaxID=7725 RepID=UPI0019396022|nr:ER membrane protein complex subunit 2-like [Styela clava]
MEDFNPEAACKRLREMRDEHVRDSITIVEIGERLIRKYSHRFGDEMWLICEQVFIAALDTCRYDLSDICLKKLETRFPDSDRVKKLLGIQFEAYGDYEEALTIYEEIEKNDPTNAAIRKRRTAILKAQGKTSDAIKSLTEYLKTFMADAEAWLELSELYTEELEYGKASYCMEEVILSQPLNHLYHQRYAEIKYTQGGMENVSLARDYFAEAVYLSRNSNMRALYGLLLACNQLSSSKATDKEKKNNSKYASWAAKMIQLQHKNHGSEELGATRSKEDFPELTTGGVTDLMKEMHLNST